MNIFDIIPKKKKVEIHDSQGNIIIVDATVSEDHVRTAQVTKHEIEGGNEISDHVVKKGAQLTLTGVISDDPINITGALVGAAAGVTGSLIGGIGGAVATGAFSKLGGNLLNNSSGISKTAHDIFEQIYEQKIPVTIITGLNGYNNMIMETLSMPRNQGTTRSLVFTATFSRVNIVSSETVTVTADQVDPAVADSAMPKKKLGNLSTTTPGAEAATKGQSLLYGGGQYLGLIP